MEHGGPVPTVCIKKKQSDWNANLREKQEGQPFYTKEIETYKITGLPIYEELTWKKKKRE